MTLPSRQPPPLVTRALIASLLTVALILVAVFVLVVLAVQRGVRDSVTRNLDAAQSVFAQVENRREQEMVMTVSALAEVPTLKAAVDTWQTERTRGSAFVSEAALTVERELGKIAESVAADAITVLDREGVIVASAGPRAGAFARGTARDAQNAAEPRPDSVVVLPRGVFRLMDVPLIVNDTLIGTLQHATALDDAYARQLSALARAETAIVVGERVRATTLPDSVARDLEQGGVHGDRGSWVVELGGESWSVRQITALHGASFLALASIDAAASEATWPALFGLGWVALASLALGGVGSFWLARTLTRPIDQLSASLSSMSGGHRANRSVPRPGTSRELDALADRFNSLMQSLAKAEAETEAAYLGAIRALAAALDARDPYTAGHSERVSVLAVEMGRGMGLDERELDVLRLGALLHDIGKIGVPDEVLRKPAALTADEFELIRAHPVIGARILRSLPFMAPYLAVVELHHERPDGQGYPYGLKSDAIPLGASIVHVADAYDAITSARAYRSGRLPHEAIVALQKGVDTDFERSAVDALVAALPRLPAAVAAFDPAAFQWAGSSRTEAS